MGAKLKLYDLLINRNRTVKHHYEYFVMTHDGLHAKAPFVSWGYAVWLNIKYTLLHIPDRELKYKQKAGNESGSAFKSAVICFYLANEGISILENAGSIGVPLPKKLKDILIQLREDNK